jgi:hypothetical protein
MDATVPNWKTFTLRRLRPGGATEMVAAGVSRHYYSQSWQVVSRAGPAPLQSGSPPHAPESLSLLSIDAGTSVAASLVLDQK